MKNNFLEKNRGQTAIEYLLIIGASILVVSIVIIFISQAIGTGTETGNESTYQYLCITLDSNTLDCGCYLGDITRGGANQELCCAKNQEILKARWDCS
ncbi:MAG: class III signal peptide-containing protein [Candidatus ainarchaeum sp.]|nr:class III signal peptide-containing protein [Candidatus ainarchaeum sp.]